LQEFIRKWNEELFDIVKSIDEKIIKDLINEILRVRERNKEIFIVGNGGSASIAEHSAVDFTNVLKVRCQAFTNPSLITCFSNDYGYENWIKIALESFLNEGDMVIFISSSGKSENILNACQYAKQEGNFVATFSGFEIDNPLKSLGNINFFANSNKYNLVETCHQAWLLMIVDYISSKQ